MDGEDGAAPGYMDPAALSGVMDIYLSLYAIKDAESWIISILLN